MSKFMDTILKGQWVLEEDGRWYSYRYDIYTYDLSPWIEDEA